MECRVSLSGQLEDWGNETFSEEKTIANLNLNSNAKANRMGEKIRVTNENF